MTMPYVDLSLSDGNEVVNLQTVLEKYKNVILLGVPGSGKSSLLNHFFASHESECELCKANEFTSALFTDIKATTKYLLIDGVDELRNAAKEKESVIYGIAAKLKKIEGRCRILVSCREIDWYGDDDDGVLRKHLTSSFKKFFVSALSETQKEEFVDAYIDDAQQRMEFKEKFLHQEYAKKILSNPLTFRMLIELFLTKPNEIPHNKIELYRKRVELAIEKAKTNLRNGVNIFSTDEIFKYSSYIAYYYLMSDVDTINNSVLEEISTETDYPYNRLLEITKLNIFERSNKKSAENDFCFCHRTIAEYLCACFLFFQKQQKDNISEEKIIKMLTSKDGNKIPSELRGVYAWYCSLSESAKAFAIDPYSQYLYGDNSLFDLKKKKKVIEAIRDYANNTKPYFIRISDERKENDFYEQGLDDFLIGEYESALKNKNNYLIFLEMIMASAENPSSKILAFSKKIILIPDLEYHFKQLFVPYLRNEPEFLKDVLQKIKDGKLLDKENELLDDILFILYPKYVTPEEIVDLVTAYKETDSFHNHYQYLKKEIDEKNIRKIIDAFYGKHANGFVFNHDFQKVFGTIVANYLMRLAQSSSPSIFFSEQSRLCIKDFNLTHSCWISNLKTIQYIEEEKKEQLYDYYLDGITPKEEKDYELSYKKDWLSGRFIDYIQPKNKIDIILRHLEKANEKISRIYLLQRYNRELKSFENLRDDADVRSIDLATKYGLEDEYKKSMTQHLSPEVLKIQEDLANRERERKEHLKKTVEENEKKLNSMSQEQKESLWGLLVRCAEFYLFESETELESRLMLKKESYQELLSILKSKISQDSKERLGYEQTNISFIAKNDPTVNSSIDIYYYCILCLNDCEDYEKIENTDFLEYLYLVSLRYKNVLHSQRVSFDEWFEGKDNWAVDTLQKYISFFFDSEKEKKSLAQFFASTFDPEKKEMYLKRLQRIIQVPSNEANVREGVIANILREFNFSLTESFLTSLEGVSETINSKRNSLIEFIKKNSSPSKDDVDVLIDLLGYNFHTFSIKKISEDYRFTFIDTLMRYFDSYESLEFHNGVQSSKDGCAFYTNNVLLNQIEGAEGIELLEKLRKKHSKDIWGPRIKTRIDEINEILTDSLPTKKTISEAKKFALEKIEMKKNWISLYIGNPLFVLLSYLMVLLGSTLIFYLTKDKDTSFLDCFRHSALSITTIGFDDVSNHQNIVWTFGSIFEGFITVLLGILLSMSIAWSVKRKLSIKG